MDSALHVFESTSGYLIAIATLFVAVATSAHALLYKRDVRATVAWVGLIWLAPVVGAFLYLMLGVNRIRRRARVLRNAVDRYPGAGLARNAAFGVDSETRKAAAARCSRELPIVENMNRLIRLIDNLVQRPLVHGNQIEPLVNGADAFDAMIQAIDSATVSISFCSYIFDRGTAGTRFVEAFQRALQRGVEVRILVDASGARYSIPTIFPLLRRAGLRHASFLPTMAPLRLMSINLRNHRKILVVDGRVGFTGGMNIRDGHLPQANRRRQVQDVHFRLRGPIVAQLQDVFAEDWHFCTRESLSGDLWFPELEPAGDIAARGISDGPDEDFEKLRWTLMGALTCAQHSVRVVTPYFLPDPPLIAALNVAALRGLRVDILLPKRNNLPFVHWAMMAQLWQVLQGGCRVWLTPEPFDHSKLLTIDQTWALVGSANWDPRSLRLNFEFNVETYSTEFAGRIDAIIDAKIEDAKELSLEEVDARPLPIKLRDGITRLLTPYL